MLKKNVLAPRLHTLQLRSRSTPCGFPSIQPAQIAPAVFHSPLCVPQFQLSPDTAYLLTDHFTLYAQQKLDFTRCDLQYNHPLYFLSPKFTLKPFTNNGSGGNK